LSPESILGTLGYVIVGTFLIALGVSVAVSKFGRIEKQFGPGQPAPIHQHTHDGGLSHWRKHFH
jgi:hypothetical protein